MKTWFSILGCSNSATQHQPYVSFWRPGNSGYTYTLPRAGRYRATR